MKRTLLILTVVGLVFLGRAYASSADTSLLKDTSADNTAPSFNSFTVETDEESARESLNRVSGEFDLGFASPDQTYESEHQNNSGPFSKKSDSSSY